MTNKYDFFSKMILDYFVSIDDSYDYMIYINGKNADISSTLRQFNIVDEIIEDNDEFVVSKFSKYEVDVYLKFVKSLNSKDGLVYNSWEIEIVEPKVKQIVYFE